jgi:hypothetical protein
MKLKGMDSCSSMLFTATRSPTDMAPAATRCKDKSNDDVRPTQKIAA